MRTPKLSILRNRSLALALAVVLVWPDMTRAADPQDPKDLAASALEFGGSIGKLLWVSVRSESAVSAADPDRYSQLAVRIQQQIDEGRASSSLVRANFDVVGTALVYTAAVDPEPLTKTVAGIAAWGAKKAGDVVGQMALEKAEESARGILAQGLKNSGLSPTDLASMTPQALRARVADFQIGGQKLRDVLAGDPKGLGLLEAAGQDLAANLGVANLAHSQGIAEDVSLVKTTISTVNQQINDFQTEAKNRFDRIKSRLSGLEETSIEAGQKLTTLSHEVQGNTRAIQTLAQISYSGWSASQKLQAVQSGMFPNLTPAQTNALVDSLQVEVKREDLLGQLKQTAHDFGNLAAIASNVGLPPGIVTGLQRAETVAQSVAEFASGDILGGLSSVASLVGLGAPDANAERFAAMMKYLSEQFTEVNRKLAQVIDLQVKTLRALAALSEQQLQFRQEVLGQLDRIESAVLTNQQLLQAILVGQWSSCYAFINGSSLNGQYDIPNRDVLTGLVGDATTRSYAESCYKKMTGFLDASVKPAQWSGQIVAANQFPSDAVAPNQALQQQWSAFIAKRSAAYAAAADFVTQLIQDEPAPGSAAYLARLTQPVADTGWSVKLDDAFLSTQTAFTKFNCTTEGVLSAPLRDLLCFGRVAGDASPPRPDRLAALLNAAPLGPQVARLLQTGIPLAEVVDFARTSDSGTFRFVKPEAISNFSSHGLTRDLALALREQKGLALLKRLEWLAEANVLQQSVAYGSVTAVLIEHTLYDSSLHALNTTPAALNTPLKQKAVRAMRVNSLLARNVLLLASRHSLVDRLGSEGPADHRTLYMLALNNLATPGGCADVNPGVGADVVLAHEKLTELFPNWSFTYRVSVAQKQKDPSLASCKDELIQSDGGAAPRMSEPGAGVAVPIDDFYVLVPSPLALATGLFEQSDDLRLALAYRDHIHQAIVDRSIGALVREQGTKSSRDTAFALLNEGWGWSYRGPASIDR
jgi:hypothetical protein